MGRIARAGGTAGALLLGLLIAYRLVLRSAHLKWGATDDEAARELPGDDLLTDADLSATRAVSIAQPPRDVWPWIAQMGQGRGGLYTYDGLENLVGCQMRSADDIVPEWQDVQVGDQFKLHPDVPLEVAAVHPGGALVVWGGVPMGDTPPPYDFTWAFVLRDAPGGGTRLLVRERYHYRRWWGPLLVEPVEFVSFLMTQKMLRGIRDRAETGPAGRTEASGSGTETGP